MTAIKIGEFLHRKKVPVKVDPESAYSLVTVKLHHNGVVLREKKQGALLGSNMYRVSAGDFILSGIDARNGAFGIVPAELDGAVVTNDFWYFEVDETKVKRDFFYWLTSTPLFLEACQKSSKGETQRVRLQKDLFYAFEFHFPPVDQQEGFLRRFGWIDASLSQFNSDVDHQSSLLTQLRQAILQEAIEGKLTAGWRRDHPVVKGDPEIDAAALLAQIQAEKARLVAEGAIKKPKPLAPIREDEAPFALPEGWVWTRLGEVVHSIKYGTSKSCSYDDTQNAMILRIPNVSSGKIDLEDLKYTNLDKEELADLGLRDGDTLVVRSNGSPEIVGTMVSIPNPPANMAFAGYLIRLRFSRKSLGNFYCCFSRVRFLRTQIEGPLRTTVGINNINTQEIASLLFPLPPFAEQRVIVEKVERLLALVEDLERQVADRKRQAEALLQTVLAEAFGEAPA